ncbi:MAG: M28 family peptidase [candidate division WOR-3 bacterium]
MKKCLVFSFVLFTILFGGEFLAIVPGINPEELAVKFKVVDQTNNGVLIIGNDNDIALLSALNGRILDANITENRYYQVHLFDWSRQKDLTQIARILDFDGENYLIAVKPEDVAHLLSLGGMLSRVSLQGWVFRPREVKLPSVTTNPLIEAMVALVSPESVLSYVWRLQKYGTRYSTSDSCKAAAEWIKAKFLAYGCDTVIMQNHTSGHAPNVVGVRYGTTGRRDIYAIICGHFDSYAPNNAPGADDNASGTAAVIEACRVTQNFNFTHDLRFIAFSGEEFGLYGSDYYAGMARNQGDSILGVLNFDMIGYVDASPESLDLMGKIANPPCEPFVDWFIAVCDTYTDLFTFKRMVNNNQNSDHGPFWNNGYLAFCGIEDFWPANPYYHTPGDSIGAGYNDNEFCTEVTKAAVAGIATLGQPLPANIPLLGLSHIKIDDAAGNADGFWDAGESVSVYLTLKNFGTVYAHNVNATLITNDTFITVKEDSAWFGNIAGGDTAVNLLPYTMIASSKTPREHKVSFDLTITASETTFSTNISLQIGRYLITDPIPDNNQPPRYWAYDDIDTSYEAHPQYDWVEINNIGTKVSFSHNDSVVVIELPSGFGPLHFYGEEFHSLSISADGWICPGSYTQPQYQNLPLPNTQAPASILCVNWDDLYPNYNNTGFVYYYYDTTNHRLVIEYDSVCYYSPRSLRDKFEVLIYDSTLTTPTNDNVIVFQYMTANGYTSSTVGIQDHTQTIGIQVLYNGSYTSGAAPIAPGRAIKFTTIAPTGLADIPSKPLYPRSIFCTNPIKGVTELRLSPSVPVKATIAVYDLLGREVCRLKRSHFEPVIKWDTRAFTPGIYFLKLLEKRSEIVKVVLVN